MTHNADFDAGAYYCSACQHPWGYHHETRGCTMPLDLSGLPVMRTDETVGPCACRVTPPAVPLPLHRTEAGYPNCSTCDGGGCYDCTDPA